MPALSVDRFYLMPETKNKEDKEVYRRTPPEKKAEEK